MAGRARIRAVPAPPPAALVAKVQETLDRLQLQPEDVALAALALRYAETIERAAGLADELAALPYDEDTVVMVSRLKQRVEAHVVMVDLGPKLQAALDALGATPKSRALAGKPAPAGAKSKLTALREAGAS